MPTPYKEPRKQALQNLLLRLSALRQSYLSPLNLTRQHVNLAKSNDYKWMNSFHRELTKKRKLALRMGENLETQDGYQLKSKPLKELLSGKIETSDLSEQDFYLDITQKGVDMRIGLDIASLSANNYVNQIVMISGDSDFVPAAKHARRTGIDFILDPMWARISDSLHEHIDGLIRPEDDDATL